MPTFEALLGQIFEAARKSDRVVTKVEIRSLCEEGGPH